MPDLQQAWTFLRNSDQIASAEQVDAAVLRVAGEIKAKLGGSYPLVLAVMGGAVVFAGQLLPMLRFPLDFDYIHASRYGTATRGAGLEWRVSPPNLAKGRAVLVVDDILDHGAQAVYSAVLVDKILDKKKPIQADFIGLSIPDRFVFGCGMDAKGFWR